MIVKPHSNAWYDRLAQLQEGYFYPWRSYVPPNNGEDTYIEMIKNHLSSEKDVIDIGCGHGEATIMFAPLCKTIIGYDRVAKYIEIAQKRVATEGIPNVTFLRADSKRKEGEHIQINIPAADHSADLFISRRGPTHWFPDVPRVAKEKAVLIQLNPLEGSIPEWNQELPEVFRIKASREFPNQDWPNYIAESLKKAGISLHSYWIFDVPQLFDSVAEYYHYLAWGYLESEIPSFKECRTVLEAIFKKHGTSDGLDIRLRRFLWKAEYWGGKS